MISHAVVGVGGLGLQGEAVDGKADSTTLTDPEGPPGGARGELASRECTGVVVGEEVLTRASRK